MVSLPGSKEGGNEIKAFEVFIFKIWREMRGDTESEHAILCWSYCRIKWYCKVNILKIESYTTSRDINVYNSIFIKLVWIILVNKDPWSVSGFSNKPTNLSLSVILYLQ